MTKVENFETQVKNREEKVKRMSTIFLTALLPWFFANLILDRLLSIIFSKNFAPYENIPPFYPIWFVLGNVLGVLVFVIAWWYWDYSKKWMKGIIVVILILFIIALGTFAEWNKPEILNLDFWEFMPVLWILMIVLFFGVFVLSTKAKSIISKVGLIVIFFIIFAVVHWGFYLPMFPGFNWAGINHTLDCWIINKWTTALSIIGIPIIIAMILLQSDKLRIRLIRMDVEKHMERAQKR